MSEQIIIPRPTNTIQPIDIYDMYVSFDEISERFYSKCKTKNIFLKKIGINIFSLEIKYKYNDTTNFIIYFSLQDNKIYFQINKYEPLLFYIFLKITSVLKSVETHEGLEGYVYVYDNSQSYMTLSTILNIIRDTDKHIIEKLSEINFVDLYQEKIVKTYLDNHKNINIFFNATNLIIKLDELIDNEITKIKCQSKRKKIKISKTQKHRPLSSEKESRRVTSLNSITRKSKGNNIASITRKINSLKIPLKRPVDIPAFNKENINIGLLIVSAHGSIPIEETTDNELQLPIVDIPVGNTKLYYKSITLPGYSNYMMPEHHDFRGDVNSEDNDYEYAGDSLMSEIKPISQEPPGIERVHAITLSHYRNIFERCFKKNPLKFYENFYSCGNKIINNFLRGNTYLDKPYKMFDYSKLNKTSGPGPIARILDKNIGYSDWDTENTEITGNTKIIENTKIIFMVYNNYSKQIKRYELKFENYKESEYNLLTKIFKNEDELYDILEQFDDKSCCLLSSIIKLVLSYRYKPKGMKSSGLDSLYVYDTSCSVYEPVDNSEITLEQLNEIDEMIDALPDTIGK